MLTIETAKAIISQNDFQETPFRCDDGTFVYVKPCSQCMTIKDFSEVEYYLVDGDLPWMGGNTLEKVLEQINGHSKLVAEQKNEEAEIRAYFDEHQKNGWSDESWSWYSDWHKDVYGYRPHGRVCGEYVRPY